MYLFILWFWVLYHVFCKVSQLNNQYVSMLHSVSICVFSLLKWTDWYICSTSHLAAVCYAFWGIVNTACVLDTILWSFMVSLAISVANFFYIFIHFFVQWNLKYVLQQRDFIRLFFFLTYCENGGRWHIFKCHRSYTVPTLSFLKQDLL